MGNSDKERFNNGSEEYKKSIEKIAKDEDSWKTETFIYTPKEIKPPKSFDFNMSSRPTPLHQKLDENKEVIVTPSGETIIVEKTTGYKNPGSGKDDFTKIQPQYTYSEEAARKVIPPTPIEMPATDYCVDDHVFLSGSAYKTDIKRKKVYKNYNTKGGKAGRRIFFVLVFVFVLSIVFVFLSNYLKNERKIEELAQEGSVNILVQPFHEYVQIDTDSIYGIYNYMDYQDYDVYAAYTYDYQRDIEKRRADVALYIKYLEDLNLTITLSPIGYQCFGYLEDVYVYIKVNYKESGPLSGMGEVLYIEYREYKNESIHTKEDWESLE